MTDLSLLLGLAPAPKAISPEPEPNLPLSGYGTGRLAILSRLHQHPDQVFNAKDLALAIPLEVSVVHKHLRGLAECGLITCKRKGNARTLALYQASSQPPAYVLELALRQANAELEKLKARAVALVLSCEPDEHGRLSLESIAQTLEANLGVPDKKLGKTRWPNRYSPSTRPGSRPWEAPGSSVLWMP